MDASFLVLGSALTDLVSLAEGFRLLLLVGDFSKCPWPILLATFFGWGIQFILLASVFSQCHCIYCNTTILLYKLYYKDLFAITGQILLYVFVSQIELCKLYYRITLCRSLHKITLYGWYSIYFIMGQHCKDQHRNYSMMFISLYIVSLYTSILIYQTYSIMRLHCGSQLYRSTLRIALR